MARRPASSERELRLIDQLPHLSARVVAELVYGNPGLRDRVLRHRRRQRLADPALADPETAAILARWARDHG